MSKTNNRNKVNKLPTSGSEEPFTEYVYGSDRWGKGNNNCYAYSIDWFKGAQNKKLQMGEIAKTLRPEDDLTDKKVLKKRTLEDLATKKNGGYEAKANEQCRPGFYKTMAFVDPGRDYHWYRNVGDMLIRSDGKQTLNNISRNIGVNKTKINSPSNSPSNGDPILIKNSGLWAHKRGLAELTTRDASGKFIKDPRRANRDYGDISYTVYAGSFCVSKNFGRGQDVSCKDKNTNKNTNKKSPAKNTKTSPKKTVKKSK